MTKRAIIIAGPTATGKSALALHLAHERRGEIISVDSMQVYRGMDIGTAKPSAAERASIPHHLIDVCELTEAFDAARFVNLATAAEARIRERGNVPIYCGGTGLYLKALLYGLDAPVPVDPTVRARLESMPLAELQTELQRMDPTSAAEIDLQNPRRVVRALEVVYSSGESASNQRSAWAGPGRSDCVVFVLNRPREQLNERINSRVDEMFASGLVEETRALLARGLEQNRTAMQAIGYRQVVEHLRGERDLTSTIELIKRKTRHFAKRQITWFKKHLDAKWLDASAPDLPPQALAQIER